MSTSLPRFAQIFLAEQFVTGVNARDIQIIAATPYIDRAGKPHFLLKTDLAFAANQAEVGIVAAMPRVTKEDLALDPTLADSQNAREVTLSVSELVGSDVFDFCQNRFDRGATNVSFRIDAAGIRFAPQLPGSDRLLFNFSAIKIVSIDTETMEITKPAARVAAGAGAGMPAIKPLAAGGPVIPPITAAAAGAAPTAAPAASAAISGIALAKHAAALGLTRIAAPEAKALAANAEAAADLMAATTAQEWADVLEFHGITV